MRIQLLEPAVADAIAAGEVVERPASVVKELVENSLDAGAHRIAVEVMGGGLERITVSDDGDGVSAEDLVLAFTRHATSKVREVRDLARITSLGFRGEALASIAAVSRVTCRSGRRHEPHGAEMVTEYGALGQVRTAGAAPGTWIEVSGLFENTPARRAFLKRPSTELSQVVRVVTALALCHLDVTFTLRIEGRSVLDLIAGRGLDERFAAVGPAVTLSTLLAVSGAREGASVAGVLAPPAGMRRTREHLYLSVNGRPVQTRALAFAIEQAFGGFAAPGLFPAGALDVTVDPETIDVNVHPTKREVRFRQERLLFSVLQEACLRALQRTPGYAGSGLLGAGLELREASPSPVAGMLIASAPVALAQVAQHPDSLTAMEDERVQRGPFRLIGQAMESYIVAEGPDGLVVVDQHAAHERIIFNQLTNGATTDEQPLLLPLVVQLTPVQAAAVPVAARELRTLGLGVEDFGPNAARLLAHDARIRPDQLDVLLRDLLDLVLGEPGDGDPRARRERLQATIACHSAVRFGQTLSRPEMESLLRQLETAEPGITCPHGRPTFLDIPEARLRREFHRS